jgi:N-methylhydantoinase B
MSETKEKYGIDKVLAEILRNGFYALLKQMSRQVIRSTFSPVLRDHQDFAAALVAPYEPPYLDLDIPAMAESNLFFTGALHHQVRGFLQEYGIENLEDGDTLAFNCPFRGGNHNMDNLFLKPIFYKGELVASIGIKAHLIDMGGPVSGGFSAEKRSMYEEGLILSGIPIYKKNKPYKPVFNLYFDHSRTPELILSDIQAIVASIYTAEKTFFHNIERHGVDSIKAGMRYSLDYGERSMRKGISELPDGIYHGEDYMDGDVYDKTPYLVKCKIVKRGTSVEIDFSGSSRQAQSSLNCSFGDTANATYVAFKVLCDPRTSTNSGAFRPIDVVVPEGSFICALPPAATTVLYEPAICVLAAVLKAIKPALGERQFGEHFTQLYAMINSGFDDRPGKNKQYMFPLATFGAFGGSKDFDGSNYLYTPLANSMDIAVESLEDDVPLMILRKEIITDSAGPGEFRSGGGILWDRLFLSDAECRLLVTHLRNPPKGVKGGKDARPGGIWLIEPEKWSWPKQGNIPAEGGVTPSEYYKKIMRPIGGFFDKETHLLDYEKGDWISPLRALDIKRNSIVRIVVNSGGGYGDPLERDPERVKRDVRDEYVSIEGAKRDYGVVILGKPLEDPENLTIDVEATKKLREQMKK